MLTAKEEKFSVNVAVKEMTYTDAYKDAYDSDNMSDKTINEKASLLAKKDKIRARIQELREEANSKAIMSAIERKKWLTKVIYGEEKDTVYMNVNGETTPIEKSPDLNTKIKALDTLNKMDGEYIEKLKVGTDEDKPFEVNIKVIK